MRALVIGGGIFGVTAAIELRVRGWDVTLVDPGPLPHPDAESTDISKVVRSDYGDDVEYTELGERAIEGWRRWNARWAVPRFHEIGVAFLTCTPMQAGGFEHASFELLKRRGHAIERLDAGEIARRFPAFRPGALVDGYVHHEGGWAESGAVVAQLAAEAEAAGVVIVKARVVSVGEDSAIDADGGVWAADAIVVCAGAWTPRLLPELASGLRATGQPVFHLRPQDPALFAAKRLPVFGADIATTGYYGFPIHGGVVKIANHGPGIAEPGERAVTAEQTAALQAFLADVVPALAAAPIVATRLCVYGDSLDGHFWIDRHPTRARVTVAAGGSGHGFKFAPVLGALIADAVEGKPHPKFRYREIAEAALDAARAR